MNILFISPEVFPFAKTGGLADVIGTLPEILTKRGHKCSTILPLYKAVRENGFEPQLFKRGISTNLGETRFSFNLYFLKHRHINVYFIEYDDYFNRDHLYGSSVGDYPDNALRFGFFSRAVLSSISYIGSQHILHCNDWQTGLIPLYLKLFFNKEPIFSETKILFSIHNMAYQGIFEKRFLKALGIPHRLYTSDYLEYYGRINFMKAGIIYSDAVSTVSESYAREILTPEFGCGLEGLLKTREKDIYGIVNGVDYSVWNPAKDAFIIARYSEKDLSGKRQCKDDLLRIFGIKYNRERPLIGMITRLAEQKGIDLVVEAMDDIINTGVNFIILGFGDEKYNNIFKHLVDSYNGYMGAKIDFDNALAHKIEAGADMFLMPSRYEPCGLNQLYSLKYGTPPVVRAVGGLEDTVEEFDPVTKRGNGFKFKEATKDAMLGVIKKAVKIYKDKDLWSTLMHNGLSCDFSWDVSAEKYERLYKKLVRT